MFKLKYKKIIIATCVITTVIITAVSFDFGSMLMRLSGHSMKNSEHVSTSHTSHISSDKGVIPNKTNNSSSTVSTKNVPNINTPPRKKEPKLTNVVFIDYVVNPIDTLWGISRNYMPNYSDQDTQDTIGIITYIAEKNNIAKGTDGKYIIYYGQKLKIPAQLSIVSNVIKQSNKNTANANNSVVTASSKQTSTTTSSNASNSSNNKPSSDSSTITSTSSNSNENLPASQTDHSSHSPN